MSLWIKAAYSQFSPAMQSLAAKSTQKYALQWLSLIHICFPWCAPTTTATEGGQPKSNKIDSPAKAWGDLPADNKDFILYNNKPDSSERVRCV